MFDVRVWFFDLDVWICVCIGFIVDEYRIVLRVVARVGGVWIYLY